MKAIIENYKSLYRKVQNNELLTRAEVDELIDNADYSGPCGEKIKEEATWHYYKYDRADCAYSQCVAQKAIIVWLAHTCCETMGEIFEFSIDQLK